MKTNIIFLSLIITLLGLLGALNHIEVWITLFVVTTIWLVLTRYAPSTAASIKEAWVRFGYMIGRLTNPIILAILYILLVSPIGIILRALGRDTLMFKSKNQKNSYWLARGAFPSNSFDEQI